MGAIASRNLGKRNFEKDADRLDTELFSGELPPAPIGTAAWNHIHLIPPSGAAVTSYPVTDAGLTAALAAATVAGSMVWLPPGTFTTAITIPANVALVALGEKASINAQITLNSGVVMANVVQSRSESNGSSIIGIVGPSSGTTYIKDCSVVLENTGAGDAYALQSGNGEIWTWNCYLYGNASGGGDGYGVYENGTGEVYAEGGWIRGSTAPDANNAIQTTPSLSVVGTGKALDLGAGGSPPAGWSEVGFNDAAWVDLVEQTSTIGSAISGTQWVTFQTGSITDELDWAYRHEFEIPYGEVTSATLDIWADNEITGVYISGTLVWSGADYGDTAPYNPASSESLDVSAFLRNGNNCIGILVENGTSIPPNPTALTYKLTLQGDGLLKTNAVRMDPVSGEPTQGDKGVWDVDNWDTRHASDINSDNMLRHLPAPGTSGNIIREDGTNWQSVAQILNANLPDPLAFKTAASLLTISGGAVTVTQNLHTISAESGTSDELDTISGGTDRQLLLIQPDSGDTITVKHGSGNININSAHDVVLSGDDTLLLFYDGTNWSNVDSAGYLNPILFDTVSILTISLGVLTITSDYHTVAAETGTTDDLDTISGGTTGQLLVLKADAGDTITVKHSTGNIELNNAADFAVAGNDFILLFYDGSVWSDFDLGGTGGGGGGDSTYSAAYASRPSPSNDGDVFFPSDGFVIERDNASAWIPWGPIFPLTKPVLGDFTWVNQGTATATSEKGGVTLYDPAAANTNANYRILKKSAPGTPYTITAMFLVNFLGINFMNFALTFRQSSDGKLVALQFIYNSGISSVPYIRRLQASGPTADVAEAYTFNMGWNTPLFLRIGDDGTNRNYYFSNDGQNFTLLNNEGRTNYITADEVGIMFSSRQTVYEFKASWIHWREG